MPASKSKPPPAKSRSSKPGPAKASAARAAKRLPAKAPAAPAGRPGAASAKARAAQAVAGRLAGRPATQIAERFSVSRKTIQRDLGSTHARHLVESLVQEHEAALRRIYARSIEVVGEGLEANIVEMFVDEEGARLASLTEIPDHKTRLEAVRRAREIFSLGLSLPGDAGPEEGTITWEQFTRLVETRETA